MGEIDLLVSQIPASVFFLSLYLASRAIILSKSVLPKCISTPLLCACIPCALAPSVCVCVCVCVCTCVCWCVCLCVCVCLCICVCVKWLSTVPPLTCITTPLLCACHVHWPLLCVCVCVYVCWCVSFSCVHFYIIIHTYIPADHANSKFFFSYTESAFPSEVNTTTELGETNSPTQSELIILILKLRH